MKRISQLINIKNTKSAAFCFLLSSTCLGPQAALAAPSDDFVTTWKTDNPGTSNDTSITVPMIGGPYDVDWENDGTFDQFGLSDSVTHDYELVGTYTVRIAGIYDSIRFGDEGDKEKILSIDQWGTNTWTSMSWSFAGALNLTIPASDTPDFSSVTDMSYMFNGASSANPDTTGWDTSAVTNMLGMFQLAVTAKPNTRNWDTSAVTDMGWMFYGASAANPDTASWNTAAVTTMSSMFTFASSANPVTHNWDTSSVTDMSYMFYEAKAAEPENKHWNTASVTNMYAMFYNATSYDQDLGSWNVSALLDAGFMFYGVTLSNTNYENLLLGWNEQALQTGVQFHGGNSTYCSSAAAEAKANMVASDKWRITDGGQYCEPEPDFIMSNGFEDWPGER